MSLGRQGNTMAQKLLHTAGQVAATCLCPPHPRPQSNLRIFHSNKIISQLELWAPVEP